MAGSRAGTGPNVVRVLVTGATGHLGPHVVRALLADGHQVTALVRPESDRAPLEHLAVAMVEGDITRPDSLTPAVAEQNAVVHMAALHDLWAPERATYAEVNIEGALNVRDAAAAAGLVRMVFVSSGSAIGELRGTTGTEDTPRRDYFLTDYEASKLAAEQELLETAPPPDIVVINPASVYGPGDVEGNGLAVVGAVSGRMRVSADADNAYVYVDDVARGIAAALVRGRPGERYILAGQNLSRRAFLERAVHLAGLEHEIHRASPLLWRVLTRLFELQSRFSGGRPPTSSDAVRSALHGTRLDGGKAARELGVTYTSLDDGLNATLDWLHDEGHVDLPEEDDDADAAAPGSSSDRA